MPSALVVLDKAAARHVQVMPRVVAVRRDLRDELGHERAVYACAVQNGAVID